jgi:hypothetical protein
VKETQIREFYCQEHDPLRDPVIAAEFEGKMTIKSH